MFKAGVCVISVWLLFTSSCLSMSISKRGQVKLCGRLLAETLNLLCEGRYYDPEEELDFEKRRIVPQVASDSYPGWYANIPSHRFHPYVQYAHHALLPFNKRQTRGVVDECCIQSCSPNVLMSYCAPVIRNK